MNFRSIGLVVISAALATSCLAEGRTMARVFWQDDADATVRCGDLKKSAEGWAMEELSIDGFPKLDPDQQSLVQMRTSEGLVIVGVHDSDDGTIGSGWVAIESGAVEEAHGDHSHWKFSASPKVSHSLIDTDQGNPAHVYKCGDSFVLANDKKNGFTMTSAKRIRDADIPAAAATFHEGGNGHITLAVSPGEVAYATWIAPAGDEKGRVDVIGIGKNQGKQYSIKCPSGMLHGATTNSGKAFFAPADGICWTEVDREVDDTAGPVVVHYLTLGKDGDDKPLRTGAFANQGHHVVFAAGKGSATKLCWIDASADEPKLTSMPIEVSEGESLSTPVTMKSRGGESLAVMFGQHKESPEDDRMLIVNLDPDGDGRFDDAKLHRTIEVGPNQMAGHSGYHAASLLPDGRHLLLTNPGDGSMWVFSLSKSKVVAKFELGGTPTRLLSIGG